MVDTLTSAPRFDTSNIGATTATAAQAVKEATSTAAKTRWYSKAFTKANVKSLGKAGLIGAGIVAAVAATGAIARSFAKRAPKETESLDPGAAPALQAEPTIPGPAEGYGEKQWQNYVNSGRAGSQVRGPGTPRMNVAEAEDMGALRGRV